MRVKTVVVETIIEGFFMTANTFGSHFDLNLTRRLRVYSVDPSLASRISTREINEITIDIPWESYLGGKAVSASSTHADIEALSHEDVKERKSSLKPGPVGEYVEVIDYDPASSVFYVPVDLNDPRLLASDGLAPSEADPQFHQQMVYAVTMATIHRFVQAFGRPIFWSNHIVIGDKYVAQFVRRLRIYPHALRARNAYYSPAKKSLLFGYFPVTAKDSENTPGTTVFTCLSHDIIAHEVTHALLDGIHPRFNEPSNPDVHAFHEAFADLVALFQRFSYAGILEREIANTRGDLSSETMLAQLAGQFGRATGHGSSLRDALGQCDRQTGQWKIREPDPFALDRETEPHKRGSYLVAAVFKAFNLVYAERVDDLFRISTQGTGVLPDGDIHPDLVNRLAREARETAAHILRMCIRAIDYCPPVDITFGDFLRAIITADLDINPVDECGYRVAFVESFRAWGIYPHGTRSMSIESLRWPGFAEAFARAKALADNEAVHAESIQVVGTKGRMMAQQSLDGFLDAGPDGSGTDEMLLRDVSRTKRKSFEALDLRQDRFDLWKQMKANGYFIWRWLMQDDEREVVGTLGLVIDDNKAPATVYRNRKNEPTIEVHSVRPIVLKTDEFGEQNFLVVEVLQRRRGYLDPEKQKKMDRTRKPLSRDEHGDFTYRAGCTFLINPENKEIRWVMRTAGTIVADSELERMRRYLTGDNLPNLNEFAITSPATMGLASTTMRDEPFALLHDQHED
tara:strand:- start:152449 stop:154674 length:2226 start_codon:yes stop_codon:yes gene_type:complete